MSKVKTQNTQVHLSTKEEEILNFARKGRWSYNLDEGCFSIEYASTGNIVKLMRPNGKEYLKSIWTALAKYKKIDKDSVEPYIGILSQGTYFYSEKTENVTWLPPFRSKNGDFTYSEELFIVISKELFSKIVQSQSDSGSPFWQSHFKKINKKVA